MAAAVDVESGGPVQDLPKDPLLDLESDLGWLCLSNHNNLSDDETEIESPPGSHVTSNESDQPLDSGPQPVIEADSNNSDGKLEKLCTMLRRHEPVFLKFSQESPQILVNSASAAKDLMQLTTLVNKTNEDRAAEAKRQAEHDKDVMLILKKIDRAHEEILTRMRTMQQRLDETVAENPAKINASMQKLLDETIAEIFIKIDASMQNGTELCEQADLSAFQNHASIVKPSRTDSQSSAAFEESGIFKTIIEKAITKLQPHISHPFDNGNNALDEDIQ
ncbi:hypothetical protein FPCIR_9048 [Fusarium pseudocircinatum]|uniref:Uncharacterized protein n=1 Tax=Fusarium pseudocircinatum TaxID=56676 RepID=A0A8H5L1U0_9HYPO|nr:hypothetical protein FPCIR_9048 [Fusarium pseudocircinatum]